MIRYFKGDIVVGNEAAARYFYTTNDGREWLVAEHLQGTSKRDDLRLVYPSNWDAYWKCIELGQKEFADPAYSFLIDSYRFDLVKRAFTNNKEAKTVLINFEEE